MLGETFSLPTRFYGGQAPIVSVRVEPDASALTLYVTDRNATYRLPVGVNAWAGGTSPVSTGYAEPYKGFARWETPELLVVKLVFTEAAFRLTLTFDTATRQLNVKTPANPGLDGRVLVARPFP